MYEYTKNLYLNDVTVEAFTNKLTLPDISVIHS